ncbi:13376_t:CDS:2 [Entrophospora sp. SA101]|nr:13376_t:CDS:2 [Entrophospora sp. SA101]
MDRIKEVIKSTRQENQALREILSQCRCGNVASGSEQESQIQQQRQTIEQLQTSLADLNAKFQAFKQRTDALLNKIKGIIDGFSPSSSSERNMIELQQLSQELAQRRAEFALIKEKLAQIYVALLPPRTLVLNRGIAFEKIVEEAIRLRSKIQEVIPILLEALDEILLFLTKK